MRAVMVRRGLPVLSLALIALGLELAVGTFSRALDTIRRVTGALVSGDPTGVYVPAFLAGLVLVGAGGAGLGASLWSRLRRGRLVTGKACPECGTRTDRIPRKRRHKLLASLNGEEIQRRLCRECGWKGLSRIPKH